jgi:hypothetical protein
MPLLQIASDGVKSMEPDEDRKQLRRLAESLAQCASASVGLFYGGGGIPLGGHQRRAQNKLQPELGAGALGRVREGHE